jgi:hypothetical protein
MPQDTANHYSQVRDRQATDLSGGRSGVGWVVAALLVAALFVGLYVLASMTLGRDQSSDAIASADVAASHHGAGVAFVRKQGS